MQALLSTNTSLHTLTDSDIAGGLSKQLTQAQRPQYVPNEDRDPYRARINISNAGSYDYRTLTTFQSALTVSIITRHAIGLRDLHLSIWALTVPIAKALAQLPALQKLSITIMHCPYVRAVPRPYIISQREEERKAWDVLSQYRGKNYRLRSLKIEDAELDLRQLLGLLRRSPLCKEISLKKCNFIGKEVWHELESEWEGWPMLEDLCISACGGILDEATLNVICRMKNLKVSQDLFIHK